MKDRRFRLLGAFACVALLAGYSCSSSSSSPSAPSGSPGTSTSHTFTITKRY